MVLNIKEIEEWDAVLDVVKERAESGKPADRWIATEEHAPLLRAALFWRQVAKEMAEGLLDAQKRTEENMGIIHHGEKVTKG